MVRLPLALWRELHGRFEHYTHAVNAHVGVEVQYYDIHNCLHPYYR